MTLSKNTKGFGVNIKNICIFLFSEYKIQMITIIAVLTILSTFIAVASFTEIPDNLQKPKVSPVTIEVVAVPKEQVIKVVVPKDTADTSDVTNRLKNIEDTITQLKTEDALLRAKVIEMNERNLELHLENERLRRELSLSAKVF